MPGKCPVQGLGLPDTLYLYDGLLISIIIPVVLCTGVDSRTSHVGLDVPAPSERPQKVTKQYKFFSLTIFQPL